jgi:hypothetical protein
MVPIGAVNERKGWETSSRKNRGGGSREHRRMTPASAQDPRVNLAKLLLSTTFQVVRVENWESILCAHPWFPQYLLEWKSHRMDRAGGRSIPG